MYTFSKDGKHLINPITESRLSVFTVTDNIWRGCLNNRGAKHNSGEVILSGDVKPIREAA
jgi:hypothetical protein